MGGKSIKQLEFDKQLDTDQFRNYQKMGEIQLLNHLYAKYIHLVYGVGFNRTHNRDSAQQVVINTYKILLSKAKKEKVSCFKTWLYQLTIEECQGLMGNDDSSTNTLISDYKLGNHILDKYRVIDKRLKDCFNNLPDEERKCVELFYQKEKSYREIAEDLKSTEYEVRAKIISAKQIINQCFN